MTTIPMKPVGRQNNQENKQEFTVSRGELLKGSSFSYSGILHRNNFKVDKEIALIGVSFFGPDKKFKDHKARYKVSLGLELTDTRKKFKKQSKTLIKLTDSTVVATRGKKFRVNFAQVVILKPDTWYEVLFELDGPETGRMDSKNIKTQCSLFHQDERIVTFDFLIGSRQMPDFHFAMVD